MNWLTEPLTYGFFVRALIAGVTLGAATGAVGAFVVLRRMSYIGHGLSHSLLGGIAIALAWGQSEYLGAIVATLVSALLIELVGRRAGLGADAAIGIVTTAMFALGVVVLSLTHGPRANAEALLFGSILGVRPLDAWLAVATAVVVAGVLFVAWKPLVFATFDPVVARAQGVRADLAALTVNFLVAGVVVVGVRLLGVLMIAAAVVIPAAAARLLSYRIATVVILGAVFGAVSQLVGLFTSWHWGVPSGAGIVLVAVNLFLFAAFASTIGRQRRMSDRRVPDATGRP